MKTMNFLFTAAFVLLLSACSNESQLSEEELSSVDFKGRWSQEQEKEEAQEIYSLDLQQFYALGQIARLDDLKRALEEEIEGGNRKLIPEMEAAANQLRDSYQKLNKILDLTCYKLKIRQVVLEEQLENATDEATKTKLSEELFDIGWKLMDCGKDSKEYLVDLSKGERMLTMGWKGSRCSPARDYKCKMPIRQGKLLINVEEELAKRTQPRVKTDNGEVISKGKLIGNHEELKDMVQFELEIKNTENGILEMGTEIGIIAVPIELQ